LPSSLVVLRDINSQVFNPLNVSQRQTCGKVPALHRAV
jgi:hypothetical protein